MLQSMERHANGNVVEQLALLDMRIERVQELLARFGGDDKLQAEGERTLMLLAQSRRLLETALR
jgi:hypothetical protein